MLPWGDKGGGCGRRGAGTQFIRAAWRTHGCIFGRFWASGGKLKIYRKCVRRRSPPESCRNGSLAALGPAQGTFSTILYRFWGEKGGKITSRFRFLRNPQFCIFFARVPVKTKCCQAPWDWFPITFDHFLHQFQSSSINYFCSSVGRSWALKSARIKFVVQFLGRPRFPWTPWRGPKSDMISFLEGPGASRGSGAPFLCADMGSALPADPQIKNEKIRKEI